MRADGVRPDGVVFSMVAVALVEQRSAEACAAFMQANAGDDGDVWATVLRRLCQSSTEKVGCLCGVVRGRILLENERLCEARRALNSWP